MKTIVFAFSLILLGLNGISQGNTPKVNNNISLYEYWFDADFQNRVSNIINTGQDYNLVVNTGIEGLSYGLHTLHLRFQDENGCFSSILSRFIYRVPYLTGTGSNIEKFEYWFDDNYSGHITQVVNSQSQFHIIEQISVPDLSLGIHTINFRFYDSKGEISSVLSRFINKTGDEYTGINLIDGCRYWFDADQGNGGFINLSENDNPLSWADTLDICALTFGDHTFNIQFRDKQQSWSSVISYPFTNNPEFDLRVILEGPFQNGIMKTDLNMAGFLPLEQPYESYPWNYPGLDSVEVIPSQDIVDWILVELRQSVDGPGSANTSTIVARKSVFLFKDGHVAGTDGQSLPWFDISFTNDIYAVIWQRNHLGIMSSYELPFIDGKFSFDFTTGSDKIFGGNSSAKQLAPGVWGMISGDGNADNQVNNADKLSCWVAQSGQSGYKSADFNLNGNVNNQDKLIIWKPNTGRACQVP